MKFRKMKIRRRPISASKLPGNRCRQTIGLLGGSFNPAHEGHLHISMWALKALGLDEVWWLVSPQNPLKSSVEMAGLDRRLAHAQKIACHPRIKISAVERDFGSRYTVDTLEILKSHFPRTKFIWLMGADNLRQFHHWQRWRDIEKLVPIVVADRAACLAPALRSKAAQFMKGRRINYKLMKYNNNMAWAVLPLPKHKASATALRKKHGNAGVFAV